MKLILILLTSLVISGCSQKPHVLVETKVVAPPLHLLSDCSVSGVESLGDSYESAFYATSEAYIKSAKKVAECNNRLKAARNYIEEAKKAYEQSGK